jgi:hypothetical protein
MIIRSDPHVTPTIQTAMRSAGSSKRLIADILMPEATANVCSGTAAREKG